MTTPADDDIPPDALDDPRLLELLDNFREMPDAMQERFLRMAQRVAALPPEVQNALTPETLRQMLENDSDFPYN